MEVKIKKLDSRAKTPVCGSPDAAGADLYALLDAPLTFAPHETHMVPTGIAAAIPENCAGLIFARSSLGSKRGLAPANKVGVIDPDYRGQIMVALHNHSEKEQTIEPFERIAQLVIVPFVKAEFSVVGELETTERGEGGFGSTGKK